MTLWSPVAFAVLPPTGQPAGSDLALCSQLRDALGTYERIAASGGWQGIDSGRSPKPGDSDPRMPRLRERLTVTGDITQDEASSSAPEVYDATLEAGVRRFQARHGLTIDGVLGPATLSALSVPAHTRVGQLQTALDRCASDLRDLPSRFIVVNVAGFRVLYVENGNVTWSSRVIVGTPYTKTPMFRANLEYVELNPTWTVPKSIVYEEIIPTIRRDPNYLSRMRMKRSGDDFVQMPGPDNALGRIKLMLPNPHDVYLHDTPTKSLFKKATRAFSHGCVRVEKPVELAALAIADPQWTAESLEAAIQTGETRKIPLQTPIPVVVTSWPATADREGTIEFLPDVYQAETKSVRRDNQRDVSVR